MSYVIYGLFFLSQYFRVIDICFDFFWLLLQIIFEQSFPSLVQNQQKFLENGYIWTGITCFTLKTVTSMSFPMVFSSIIYLFLRYFSTFLAQYYSVVRVIF